MINCENIKYFKDDFLKFYLNENKTMKYFNNLILITSFLTF